MLDTSCITKGLDLVRKCFEIGKEKRVVDFVKSASIEKLKLASPIISVLMTAYLEHVRLKIN